MSDDDNWYVAKTQDDGVIARLQEQVATLTRQRDFASQQWRDWNAKADERLSEINGLLSQIAVLTDQRDAARAEVERLRGALRWIEMDTRDPTAPNSRSNERARKALADTPERINAELSATAYKCHDNSEWGGIEGEVEWVFKVFERLHDIDSGMSIGGARAQVRLAFERAIRASKGGSNET